MALQELEQRPKLSAFITLVGAILIYYVSSISFSPSTGTGSPSINAALYHYLAFFTFALFFMITTVQGKYTKNFNITILLTLLYATLDEIHQYYVPGRAMSIEDLAIDFLGILTAYLLYRIILQQRKK